MTGVEHGQLRFARNDGYRNPMTSDHLFVYGTLMRGFDHPMAKLLSRSADFVGEAHCRGRLYRVKHYPGLVLSDDARDIVFGEVYRLRQPVELLREFDMYEACGEGFAEPTEYLRRMLKVTLDDGSVSEARTEAWTYVYNWPVAHLPRIVSGRFLEG
jgi:gamma-glutamylcyclotransferase (GGCT)/AIG2-like uncharacterized protein YtfP